MEYEPKHPDDDAQQTNLDREQDNECHRDND